MRNAIRDLVAQQEYPSVSILMPTHRAHPETQQDPIRLKNLIEQARRRLEEEVGKRPSWPLMERLEGLAEEIDWRQNMEGLALFANDNFSTFERLPFTVDERVSIDRNFETRALVTAFQRFPRYRVLTLAEQPSRLFEGENTTLEEVEQYGFPLGFSGTPGATRRPDGAMMQRSNIREAHLAEFYTEVDKALTDAARAEELPLVLVGAQASLAAFDEVTANAAQIIARVEGSHDEMNGAAIAEIVWPEVQGWLATQREAAVESVGAALGAKRLASGIDDAWKSAVEGRGTELVVEEGYRQPAMLQRDGYVLRLVGDDSTADGPKHLDDAIDELVQLVLEKGGEITFVDDGALADYARVALILRY
ncbi:MAG: hypothetical protein ABI305_08335 [Tepidiformaceae bacterium]